MAVERYKSAEHAKYMTTMNEFLLGCSPVVDLPRVLDKRYRMMEESTPGASKAVKSYSENFTDLGIRIQIKYVSESFN